jgi:3-hydroxyisobutyrate dehydrogenase-like beta-hydroxyacid dehydrogenase
MAENIGFIGTGNLGMPIACNLLDAGRALTVWNRTRDKAISLAAKGALIVDRAVDVVTPGGIVVSLLWDSAAVEDVVATNGFLDRLGPGGVHVVMCTGAVDAMARLAALHADHGCSFVEAPIFGRPEAAAAKQLWIPVAGAAPAKERVRCLLEDMGAQGVFDFGDQVGAATIVKLVGNFLIVSAATSLSEGLAVAGGSGIDVRAVVDMLTRTLFPAPVYQNYGKLILAGMASMRGAAIPVKDIGLFEAAAIQAGQETPVAQMLGQLLQG